jgi:hypothetical protein
MPAPPLLLTRLNQSTGASRRGRAVTLWAVLDSRFGFAYIGVSDGLGED